MSRIGKKPITVPEKVSVEIRDSIIEMKGPAGSVSKKLREEITVKKEGNQLKVIPKDESAEGRTHLLGTARTLIANMVEGVVEPWKKELEIQGVGFRAFKNGQILNLQIGYSHPIDFKVPDKIQFSVDAKQVLITLTSVDKELLGITAAKIRSLRPPEPYKGKGIRYLGEQIMKKAGKAAGAVGTGVGGAKK